MEASEQTLITRGRTRQRFRTEPSFARRIRERAGLTQCELAQLLGVNQATVCRWETGKRLPRTPALDRYIALIQVLDQ